MQYLRKTEIVERLKERGIEFKKNPSMTLRYYENEGLIPKAVAHGFGRGRGKASFYPEITVEMIIKLRGLQESGYKLKLIKHMFDEEFRKYYQWQDLKVLKSLRFGQNQVIESYGEIEGIEPDEIMSTFGDIKFKNISIQA